MVAEIIIYAGNSFSPTPLYLPVLLSFTSKGAPLPYSSHPKKALVPLPFPLHGFNDFNVSHIYLFVLRQMLFSFHLAYSLFSYIAYTDLLNSHINHFCLFMSNASCQVFSFDELKLWITCKPYVSHDMN